ncbi:alpha-glucosidase/alpha-galactosidase [Alsobacter sp. SYSU M60028]|uniref:Alpha-glucosidase/alpha-galactosidase n=1 Tax=Alsobacter ponti TaxID=2962936 RepID=A0ABT1LGP0_9HYPH|nr:alpha-glucosidase/alpha-galactosidase [Alsobacter ponti]
MARTTRIVFLGAGSKAFGLSLLRDVLSSPALRGATLCLVDTDRAALERMAELAGHLNRHMDAGLVVESTTDREQALPGARFVVNATAIERNRLWKLDFEVPRKFGIRHTLGENGGPGALFFTLRTLPLVFDIARDIARLAPDALFINCSNPESRIVLALRKYTGLKVVGLCHGLSMSRGDIARILGLAPERVSVVGAGLNHAQWLLRIRDHETGDDLYPMLRAREPKLAPADLPLTRALFRAFGYWPTCSDSHLGEYFSFGWQAGESGYDFAADERSREDLDRQISAVIDGGPIPGGWLSPSGEGLADIMEAVVQDRPRLLQSAILYNEGAIPNLPSDLAVEVPAVADAGGVRPVAVGALPDPIAKLLAMPAHVHQLAVEAAVHASRDLALQALLVDPVVNSIDAAVGLLAELWDANRPYIRPCL